MPGETGRPLRPKSSSEDARGNGFPNFGALVHEVHEPLGLGRGEVDVVGDAVLPGDANREPAATGREHRLALGKGAQRVGSSEFRHDDRLDN